MDFCLPSVQTQLTPTTPPLSSPGVAVQVRGARLKDIKPLADVLLYSFHPDQGWASWLLPLLRLGIWEDLRSRLRGNTPYYQCLVAIRSAAAKPPTPEPEEILGTVEISVKPWLPRPSSTGYIANLAVVKAHRRRGIARQLLLKCEQVASAWNCRSLSLHVLENNWGAKTLYFSLGYQCQKTEGNLRHLLFQSPRRLHLVKTLVPEGAENPTSDH